MAGYIDLLPDADDKDLADIANHGSDAQRFRLSAMVKSMHECEKNGFNRLSRGDTWTIDFVDVSGQAVCKPVGVRFLIETDVAIIFSLVVDSNGAEHALILAAGMHTKPQQYDEIKQRARTRLTECLKNGDTLLATEDR